MTATPTQKVPSEKITEGDENTRNTTPEQHDKPKYVIPKVQESIEQLAENMEMLTETAPRQKKKGERYAEDEAAIELSQEYRTGIKYAINLFATPFIGGTHLSLDGIAQSQYELGKRTRMHMISDSTVP